GMTPETLSKAFEPFFTTKPFGTGTGLGLSMVFGFTRQSGGDIKVESSPGRGTTVSIFLPRHDGHVTPNPDETDISDDHSGRKRETILIVDDEPSIRMLVADVLSNLGYATLEAADGVDGLKILQSDAVVDLLITDVGLPGGMNGRQMAGVGRKSRPNLPVLFITGYAESAVLKDVHLEPCTHVLTKPFGLDVLTSMVADLVE
ncbi:response regulator, partial [Pseudomonas edaphica]